MIDKILKFFGFRKPTVENDDIQTIPNFEYPRYNYIAQNCSVKNCNDLQDCLFLYKVNNLQIFATVDEKFNSTKQTYCINNFLKPFKNFKYGFDINQNIFFEFHIDLKFNLMELIFSERQDFLIYCHNTLHLVKIEKFDITLTKNENYRTLKISKKC